MILTEKDFFSKGFDLFLGLVKKVTNGKILGAFETWSAFLGLWLLAGAALLGLIRSLMNGGDILLPIVFFLVGLALLFVSAKFLDGLKGLVAASPTGFASRAVPDTFGILMFLGAVALVVLGLINLFKGDFLGFITNLVLAVTLYLMSCAVLDDSAINLQVGSQVSPGEEFISIILVPFKSILLALPVIFGLLSAAIFVFSVWGLFDAYVNSNQIFSVLRGFPGFDMVRILPANIIPIILPLYFYFLFLALSFFAGIFQGLLSLKKKGN